jgi:hypothetical protein
MQEICQKYCLGTFNTLRKYVDTLAVSLTCVEWILKNFYQSIVRITFDYSFRIQNPHVTVLPPNHNAVVRKPETSGYALK